MQKLNLVIIEDDPTFSKLLSKVFGSENVSIFHNSEEFFESLHLHEGSVDLILQGLCSPSDLEGAKSLELLPSIRKRFPNAEIWVQSAVTDISMMKAAVNRGANRFITKESLPAEAAVIIDQVRDLIDFRSKALDLLRGSSPLMIQFREQLSRLKFSSAADVLIEAETGSGKELCAKLLAGESSWVAVNCSAVPPELFEAEFFGAEKGAYTGATQSRVGHFESCADGILFSDEIQSMPLTLQAKLLRVLEDRTFMRVGSSVARPFRGRVVSASNVHLAEKVSRGLFREDLYYRLSVLKLQIPPLRVRKGDIGTLFNFFIAQEKRSPLTVSADALNWLENFYEWPGNVRELKSLAKRACAVAQIPVVDLDLIQSLLELDLVQVTPQIKTENAFEIDWKLGMDANVERLEKAMLTKAQQMPKSSQAREFLKLGRTRYYEKLREFGLTPPTPSKE